MIWLVIFFALIVGIVVFTRFHKKYSTDSDKSKTDNSVVFEENDTNSLSISSYIFKIPLVLGNTILSVSAILVLIFTSVVIPSGDQIATFDRIYMCDSIEDGRNIALPGECGRRSDIMMPGFNFSPFIRLLSEVNLVDILEVEEGTYATLNALDGLKLPEGQVAAPSWPLGKITTVDSDGNSVSNSMLDATYFLTDGKGHSGPQATILLPKRYPINPFLWNFHIKEIANNESMRVAVPPGFVAVIKSAIDEAVIPSFMINSGSPVTCGSDVIEELDKGQLKAVLVPVGCRGVWKTALGSGEFWLNEKIYEVTLIDTRVQNWTYKGNYSTRDIDLLVAEDGSITQIATTRIVPKDPKAAGDVITLKSEGWTVYQELRIQARVSPEDAPLMVASVGGLQEIEDRIITPQVRSKLRNIGGSVITVSNRAAYEKAKSKFKILESRESLLADIKADLGLTLEKRSEELIKIRKQISLFELPDPNLEVTRSTRVLDFQDERAAIEKLVIAGVEEIGKSAGIEIVSVALANTDLPPELLVARKIEQLSGQLQAAYIQKRAAQVQRQATEAAKARADKQSELITAKIEEEKSVIQIRTRSNLGKAEREFLTEKAKGQEAQAKVLGKDRVATLRSLEMILALLEKKPELLTGIKFPQTFVTGGGGLEGAAAIFGGTDLFKSSNQSKK